MEHYELVRNPPKPARAVGWNGDIPVILEAQYVVGDESLRHRGLYKITTHIFIWESERPVVTFLDFAFVRSVDEGSDDGHILNQALTAEENAQRALFNPMQKQ